LSHFGFNYLEQLLKMQDRRIAVIDLAEIRKEDLIHAWVRLEKGPMSRVWRAIPIREAWCCSGVLTGVPPILGWPLSRWNEPSQRRSRWTGWSQASCTSGPPTGTGWPAD